MKVSLLLRLYFWGIKMGIVLYMYFYDLFHLNCSLIQPQTVLKICLINYYQLLCPQLHYIYTFKPKLSFLMWFMTPFIACYTHVTPMLHPCYTHVTPKNCLFWPQYSYFSPKINLCNHISVFWIDLNGYNAELLY